MPFLFPSSHEPLSATTQSARGLAHSKTLRATQTPSPSAPASWSAAALCRFFPDDMKSLSAREREVFKLLAQGFYYREIAARLGITYATVHAHLRHIYKKLQVHSRSQAVAAKARRNRRSW
jgi:DNA-binding CsgD family transcriptional regulator